MADEKIIFSMNGVGKVLPHNNKVILKDIYLSFFYGAKIGIIGLNGSGKSTLMKIIAGVEKSYRGEVVWAPGYSVGYLEQEPQMDPDKTVIEVVQEGVQEVMDVLNEYNEISLKFMEPMDDDQMNALIERQGELSEKIEHLGGWEIDEFRKAERHPRQVSIDGRQIEDEGSDAAEREDLFRKVEASVDSELTELQKLIVRKHEYEGQSFERIAKDLGMRQEAVRMHISRARKILRDKFRNETDE